MNLLNTIIFDSEQPVKEYFKLIDQDLKNVYITVDGRKVGDDEVAIPGKIYRVNYRLLGGKGGFGSMLRAMGAQIEKTTNREACRDLSGRRIRDVNTEKKLRDWAEGQEERDKERDVRRRERRERRKKKGELAAPQFNDQEYTEQKQKIKENLVKALKEGLREPEKRKAKEDMKDYKKMAKNLKSYGVDLSSSSDDGDDGKKDEKIVKGCDDDDAGKEKMDYDGKKEKVEFDESSSSSSSSDDDYSSGSHSGKIGGGKGGGGKGGSKMELQEGTSSFKADEGGYDDDDDAGRSNIEATSDNTVAMEEVEVDDGEVRKSGDGEVRKSGDGEVRKSGDGDVRKGGDGEVRKSGDPTQERTLSTSINNNSSSETPMNNATESKNVDSQQKQQLITTPDIDLSNIDLSTYYSIEDLEKLGLDNLKELLKRRGVKCGGTLKERSTRLFAIKSLTDDQIPSNLMAKRINKGNAKK